ncbi:malate synthase A [Robertkochia aurantiaca]|uniref:malate synthase A n=1 Tax=Robertkochia aurantiaca TaxID=2873700 RepID=UPI001CCA26FD|nr:malate synthase A [Robertkochia sp. 3YJGBD-33]
MFKTLTTKNQELEIAAPEDNCQDLLTQETQAFLVALHRRFNPKRLSLLHRRETDQLLFDEGKRPEFPPETADIRSSQWRVGNIPADLLDRRVEITGPTDRKMMINALNSGASCYMADLEDSTAPSWENIVSGQRNLIDAVKREISFENPDNGKKYRLNDNTATLIVRPRGWHLNERHIFIDGEMASASLTDFGLYVFHNAKELVKRETGPYFYLPKLEHYLEARLWNDVFDFTEDYLELPTGTIKATVLIETITASFQLDEIIYELKDHIVGLNCGRWDYIFSYIKKLRNQIGIVPDRSLITMETPFMRNYSKRVIQVCHNRGIHAIGGMAAQIPVKGDENANREALAKVEKDKLREVTDGHDGTWVAHPALVPVARKIFDKHMPDANQIEKPVEFGTISAADLLEEPDGPVTEAGVRLNINVGLLYLVCWLNGNGAAALYNLMEDAATAEICRAQLWQWYHRSARLDSGKHFDDACYQLLFDKELARVRHYMAKHGIAADHLEKAIEIFHELVLCNSFKDFLTLKAYRYLA